MMRSVFLPIVCMSGLLLFWACSPAFATSYPIDGSVIGTVTFYETQADDNLYAISRRFDLGIVEVLAANPGIDPWMPPEGTKLTLPTMHILPSADRVGLVINLSELRLYYYPDTRTVITYPIGIGREGSQTPMGKTLVSGKRKYPVWIPPASIRKENPDLPEVVAPGPDNPLGDYALDLGWKDYRIHGTNQPGGVGKRISHGCIRLYPEDIAALFPLIKKGTPVTILDKEYNLGWQRDQLWLQVTPTQQQADFIAAYQEPPTLGIPEIYQTIAQTITPMIQINWSTVEKAIHQRTGIPVIIAPM